MIDIQFSKFNFHLSSQEENSKNHLFSNHFLENVNTFKTFSKNGKYYTRDTWLIIRFSKFHCFTQKFTENSSKILLNSFDKKKKLYILYQKPFSKILMPIRLIQYSKLFSITQSSFTREKFNETSLENPLSRPFLKNFFSIPLRRERRAANIRRVGHIGGSPRWTKDGTRVQTFVRGRPYPSREFGYRPLETEADRSIPDNAQEKA